MSSIIGQLRVLNGSQQGATFLLEKRSVFELGRASSSTIQIKDESVAMNHCRIYRESNSEYILYDLNSASGTKINGAPVQKTQIHDGDVLQVGQIQLKFEMVPYEEKETSDEDVEGFTLGGFTDHWSEADGCVDRSASYAGAQEATVPISSTAIPSTPSKTFRFTIVEGEDKGKSFTFNQSGTYLVGRAMDAHIKIMDIKSSRHHCTLEKVGDEFYITDGYRGKLSRNGTYLNGQKVESRTKLRPNDYIKVGFTVIKYEVL
ncbi:MAG: FHA domain-containing protein [Planctomycetota bacterium]|nr:MAG: FHA domain-containing protein [Planctomycetota bacterium]